MASLDVICIGAINYDYMFHCTGLDLVETSAGGGDENLSNPISDVENDIQEAGNKRQGVHDRIGGSAFITLKVAKHILPNLQVAYVGVCGTPSPFDLRFGKTNDIDAELAHLDNRDWLFTTRANASTIHIPKRLPNRLSAFIITRATALRLRRVPTTLS